MGGLHSFTFFHFCEPNDTGTGRRFNPRHPVPIQFAIIALLLWNQHHREQTRLAEIRAMEQSLLRAAPTPLPAIDPVPNPSPPLLDDKALGNQAIDQGA